MGPELAVLLADPAQAGLAFDLLASADPAGAALFLMDDGVALARDPRLAGLLAGGLDAALCAADAQARGLHDDGRGPRFSAQHEHARLVRDARRFVALCGVRVDDQRPRRDAGRTVRVRLTRPPDHPRTAQGLRSAVGYLAVDLTVEVRLEEAALALLLGPQPDRVTRAVATLRAVPRASLGPAEPDAPPADVEVTW
jgi:hypothetical protein